MAKRPTGPVLGAAKHVPPPNRVVDSLLDVMKSGEEYGSITGMKPSQTLDLAGEVVRAIQAVIDVRQRPCISYIGNVVSGSAGSGIDPTDDLPFHEMVGSVPSHFNSVDVILATGGGSAHQVSRFVNALRSRFAEVDFLIPSFCMSAGTIFALSGDRIWMTDRACLGPIDPQVPSKDGRLVPAQALLSLVQRLQREGEEAIRNGAPVPWTAVRMIDSLDKKELAAANSASAYSITMSTEFLFRYKLRGWTVRSSTGKAVTDTDRKERATKIATQLASHELWKSHGHAISRTHLWDQIRVRIDHPENHDGLNAALVRFWALCTWLFDHSALQKFMISPQYRYVRQRTS
jgi:hypothetical protein